MLKNADVLVCPACSSLTSTARYAQPTGELWLCLHKYMQKENEKVAMSRCFGSQVLVFWMQSCT